jgi:hypothetical protein
MLRLQVHPALGTQQFFVFRRLFHPEYIRFKKAKQESLRKRRKTCASGCVKVRILYYNETEKI